MFGKRSQKSDIIGSMSIFSFDDTASVSPVDPVEETVEEVDHYADVSDEDYTTAEEPDFGEDL